MRLDQLGQPAAAVAGEREGAGEPGPAIVLAAGAGLDGADRGDVAEARQALEGRPPQVRVPRVRPARRTPAGWRDRRSAPARRARLRRPGRAGRGRSCSRSARLARFSPMSPSARIAASCDLLASNRSSPRPARRRARRRAPRRRRARRRARTSSSGSRRFAASDASAAAPAGGGTSRAQRPRRLARGCAPRRRASPWPGRASARPGTGRGSSTIRPIVERRLRADPCGRSRRRRRRAWCRRACRSDRSAAACRSPRAGCPRPDRRASCAIGPIASGWAVCASVRIASTRSFGSGLAR